MKTQAEDAKMPRMKDWKIVGLDLSPADASFIMETFKASKIMKSQAEPCNLCSYSELHSMRYQLLRCTCELCSRAVAYAACPWQAKVSKCSLTGKTSIWELSDHVATAHLPRPTEVTEELKAFTMARAQADSRRYEPNVWANC
ncbi:unnamed protein product [Phytophthora fragariaefolia]|uniref:Unnamed protein product n=1 Tax=Phytophthora fragariaefolia TaxID=1490495 RepID=A0A9W6XVA4_9STRA|nr:unnamed protein product [Phytophthora fragariaefolia]